MYLLGISEQKNQVALEINQALDLVEEEVDLTVEEIIVGMEAVLAKESQDVQIVLMGVSRKMALVEWEIVRVGVWESRMDLTNRS